MADDFDNLPAETQLELGRLAYQLSRHKDTRRSFLKDTKKLKPDYTLPGDQQVQDLRDELEAKDEKNKIDAATAANTARLEKQRQGLLDGTLIPGRKFDADAIKEIEEKIMPKYGIADYEAAGKIYASDFKPPQPKPGDRTAAWSFPDIPGLMDDPAKAAREAAHSIIDEMQGRA